MAKKAAENTEELVKQSLVKLATADTPLRLLGRGDHPALLAGTAAANRAVLARLKDEAAPLVVETGTGRSASVRLTSGGFSHVAAALPEEKVGPVARTIAESLPLAERVAFLQDIVRRTPPAAAELLPVIESAAADEKAAAEARLKAAAAQRERDAATLEAIKRWEAVIVARKAARIAALQQELAAEGAEPVVAKTEETTAPRPVATRPPVEPQSEDDRDFRRDVAERLVSSWRDAVNMRKDEARRFLETALDNISGLRRVGEEGDSVGFDGALHENIPGVFADQPVKVTRNGWALEIDDDREFVIQKAQVTR